MATTVNKHMICMNDWEETFFHSHVVQSMRASPCIAALMWSFNNMETFFQDLWKLGGDLFVLFPHICLASHKDYVHLCPFSMPYNEIVFIFISCLMWALFFFASPLSSLSLPLSTQALSSSWISSFSLSSPSSLSAGFVFLFFFFLYLFPFIVVVIVFLPAVMPAISPCASCKSWCTLAVHTENSE